LRVAVEEQIRIEVRNVRYLRLLSHDETN
jgi:hypothetical protein